MINRRTQGSKLASKGAYIDVSDRRMQVQLTQEAKIAPDFFLFRAIFAFVDFISALRAARFADPFSVTQLPCGAEVKTWQS